MNREPSDPESYFTGSTRTPPGRKATPSQPHVFLFRLLFTYWYLFMFLPSSLYPAEALPLDPTPACAPQVQEEPPRVGRRRSVLEKAFRNGPGDRGGDPVCDRTVGFTGHINEGRRYIGMYVCMYVIVYEYMYVHICTYRYT